MYGDQQYVGDTAGAGAWSSDRLDDDQTYRYTQLYGIPRVLSNSQQYQHHDLDIQSFQPQPTGASASTYGSPPHSYAASVPCPILEQAPGRPPQGSSYAQVAQHAPGSAWICPPPSHTVPAYRASQTLPMNAHSPQVPGDATHRRQRSYADVVQVPRPNDPAPLGQGSSSIPAFGSTTSSEHLRPQRARQPWQSGPYPEQQPGPGVDMRRPPDNVIVPLLQSNIQNIDRHMQGYMNPVAGWIQVPRAAGERTGFPVNHALILPGATAAMSPQASVAGSSGVGGSRRLKTEILSANSDHTCECGAGFASSEGLGHHIRNVHGGRAHVCPECDRGFCYPKDLQRHYEERHSDYRPHMCHHPNCKYHTKGFKRRDQLVRHLRKCTAGVATPQPSNASSGAWR